MAKTFRLGPEEANIGVVLYGSNSNVAISLSDGKEITTFLQKLDNLPYTVKGARCLNEGLAVAASGIFSPDSTTRRNTLKALVYLTNGPTCRTRYGIPLRHAVRSLRKRFVRVFAVGVRQRTPNLLLQRTTTNPNDIFRVDGFEDLRESIKDLSAKMCRGM